MTNVDIVTLKNPRDFLKYFVGTGGAAAVHIAHSPMLHRASCFTELHASQSSMLHTAPCFSLLYFMGLGSQKMKNIVKETTYEDFMIKLNDILEEFLKFYRKFTLNYCPSKNLI